MDHPKITEGISFESYPSTKKFLSCVEDPKGEVEVEVNGKHSLTKYQQLFTSPATFNRPFHELDYKISHLPAVMFVAKRPP